MRIEQLTFTRFLAAITIVIFHYGKKSFLFNNKYVEYIFFNASVFVSYFFILSGFVMIAAYSHRSEISSKEYYLNRFARIYPLYFLAILIVFILQIRLREIDLLGLVLNILMIQSWVPSKMLSINPPGWSLSVELIFYLLFPFLFNKLFKRISFKSLAVYIISFWILSQIVYHLFFDYKIDNKYLLLNGNPIMHLNEFLIGNLAGLFFVKYLKDKKANYDFFILVLFGLVALSLKFPIGLHFHNGLLAVFFVPLIILISINNGLITKMFKKKAFVFLGEISYGIYILQHPIYSLISAYSVNKYFNISDPTIVFLLRLILLIVVSAFLYVFVEKPLRNRMKSKRNFLEFTNENEKSIKCI
ncbi:acyltransferase family protein [Flavobacterium quisquiliarum]|uniref:Acyltransferase family protein n=1 Tax=Flavobacterium quisquiliarum TaxID=1834436 RepID=A0ABV8WC64_9FLAO|nr:acyltransferase [Flavobacterium quisquiliarum]MBW1657722.1 acyltransferase family protein [Flavobacterium quisquiliarum]NWL04061.1 hypothetical protein [Flavobacterium collinsii]